MTHFFVLLFPFIFLGFLFLLSLVSQFSTSLPPNFSFHPYNTCDIFLPRRPLDP
eukprot:TRINITY_DN130_c0_g1_i3.p1 TRINITY_DN130_c0_g1~~TRINITY_DN130_c0_g1_i3.p1  ORF type:complete len:54 (-),score=0.92 TRINITY_DN130_c0_g1_i3:80-241(-)